MNAEKWKQTKAAFEKAVELPTELRQDLLAGTDTEIRVEVEKMLAADKVDLAEHSPLFQPAPNGNGRHAPERIKQYKIEKEIGRGGMGAVYLAIRDDGEFKQKAAIKIIKRGMDSDDILRRFRNERQILAELQHENIARLFDGGVTDDGVPFYVMEFIDGVPIDVFCRENDLNIAERLELFRKVCSAVSYAHGQLIVHRDLKPSNILVCDDGTPKLLDFGIAKILDTDPAATERTATVAGMLTPAYASPEQIRGERITTTSDVYSLGVILYELLTGGRPYSTDGKSYAEILDLVCKTEPRKPSETSAAPSAAKASKNKLPPPDSALKGDLDNITLNALQKLPERRYQSVQELSEDIRRYLAGLPIAARPDSAAYRLRKFISRNKLPAVAAAIVFISLCSGIGIAAWQARVARQQSALSEKRFNEVRQLANNVVFKYHDAVANLPGSTGVREMLVKDALQYLDVLAEEASEDVALQKELALAYLKLGDVQGKMYVANVGDTGGSLASYRKAVDLLEKAAESSRDLDTKKNLIKAYDSLAMLTLRTEHYGGGEAIVRKALAVLDELPDSDERQLQKIDLFIRLGDFDVGGGQDYFRRLSHHLNALQLIEELVRNDPENFEKRKVAARVYQRLGTDYSVIGNISEQSNTGEDLTEIYANALEYNRRFYAAVEKMAQLKPSEPSVKRYRDGAEANLAEALAQSGFYDEALRLAVNVHDASLELRRSDPQNKEARFNLSLAHELYAKIYLRQKDYANYLDHSEKTLQIDSDIFESDPKNMEVFNRIRTRHAEMAKVYEQIGNSRLAEYHRRGFEKIANFHQSQ